MGRECAGRETPQVKPRWDGPWEEEREETDGRKQPFGLRRGVRDPKLQVAFGEQRGHGGSSPSHSGALDRTPC